MTAGESYPSDAGGGALGLPILALGHEQGLAAFDERARGGDDVARVHECLDALVAHALLVAAEFLSWPDPDTVRTINDGLLHVEGDSTEFSTRPPNLR
jgi:hypothetical protein